MIQVIPAIDLIGGKCVRLSQGDFSRKTTYEAGPAEMVSLFLGRGLRSIHIVDLDGAREGRPVNLDVLRQVSMLGNADIEWGGGIKTRQDVQSVLDAGASRVICGTMAVKDPSLFTGLLEGFGPDRIVLGADVRGREVSVRGWMENGGIDIFTLLRSFIPPLKEVIVTEISRDGMLCGSELGLYEELMNIFPDISFTASGGVGCLEDIRRLEKLGVGKVIVGKALYEGRIKLEEISPW
ncbi:MAG: 1-(5-phosphoribosyl)-5-[(5-phosphoribosylamino)methylideneamino] imidazole-4-carboxamide isomerase [Bacteroidales bacterium]|nr:1-(5-phosphoribosyl)-5-[(5-phosphoribosylamino)methylideneamino] imidazole-4-carboxamide isomerase [Bacteroidales bacterium]